MTASARSFLAELARALGTAPPTDAEMNDLLALASVAAHASERVAAPLACWLAARAGHAPAEALAIAQELADRGDDTGEAGGPHGEGPA